MKRKARFLLLAIAFTSASVWCQAKADDIEVDWLTRGKIRPGSKSRNPATGIEARSAGSLKPSNTANSKQTKRIPIKQYGPSPFPDWLFLGL
jgi:hypothetical protein